MAHGDDNGLKLPPAIAPIQLIIVPIPGYEKSLIKAKEIYQQLKETYRVEIDNREGETAGFKFNKWELKGVPLRLEIGDRDLDNNSVILTRRDNNQKITVTFDNLESEIKNQLKDIQINLLMLIKIYSKTYLYR